MLSSTVVYPLESYSLQERSAQTEDGELLVPPAPPAPEDPTAPLPPPPAPPVRDLRGEYKRNGMRTSVYAVILVHRHGHPHVLALSAAARPPPDSAFPTGFMLPGGVLKPGEDERDGLKRVLEARIGVDPDVVAEARELEARGVALAGAVPADQLVVPWEIGELVASWWRPSFASPALYPYLPVHVSKPRECIRLFHVHLPQKRTFAIPSNYRLTAVPFFDLFNNQGQYSNLLASVPHLFSRYTITFASADDDDEDDDIFSSSSDSDDDDNLALAQSAMANADDDDEVLGMELEDAEEQAL
ncbi:cleavage and polyadenylation specific factor 5 [Thecamonas trahens ATCC 50062]|uniref:Cleavage and polyadenylation specificity factor subunit 5 n=1 Tax=Thecamonas trahens ATCC 50062 TaxID=461836 RepID=A0A0L0D799_THETB|nr:cleavage and polyadenylation specific factor 5 [Thecamonas trahens ATCC 50062]KNC48262.1 cleavage and polyadenylation specific factor 5 [Thecamonas trahens ATCC 50062]|eukprot:XP_013758829.1 cleavage and polyadenylation specific factor 5 [Thecamonas trahens ATCC 50062]